MKLRIENAEKKPKLEVGDIISYGEDSNYMVSQIKHLDKDDTFILFNLKGGRNPRAKEYSSLAELNRAHPLEEDTTWYSQDKWEMILQKIEEDN